MRMCGASPDLQECSTIANVLSQHELQECSTVENVLSQPRFVREQTYCALLLVGDT